VQLRSLDLNLLLVFEAVLDTRNVTRAADKLGLSQPAMSHALNRLRWQLRDQLFVRTPDGMTPTPRAELLAEPIRRTLADLQRALTAEAFAPETAERAFSIAVNNHAAIVLAPALFSACKVLAPGVRLSLRPSGTLDVPDLLHRGDLDVAIVSRPARASWLSSAALREDRYVAVARRGHPAAQQPLTPEGFAAAPQLVISSSGDDLSFVDAELEARGLVRAVTTEAPYLAAGAILMQSDMLAVIGRQVAEEFQRAYPIEILALPFESPGLPSSVIWHSRLDEDDGHRWLRTTIASVAA
jgi:DNA-binding transcriptional LysR family regulator